MDAATTIKLRSGAAMPVLGLGTWALTDDPAGTIEEAVARGYRMIDTAADYGSQPGIGEAVTDRGIGRERLYVVAKVEETDAPYEATRRYLGELRMDFADLVLIHRPPASGAGEDLWRGLLQARADGLTRDIGVSNYSTDLLTDLIEATGEVPVVNQIEWSPFGHSEAMLRYCRERDIAIQAYSPLTRTQRLDDETLAAIASGYGKTPAQVLIRWSLQSGTVPLPKANRLAHLQENVEVFDFAIDDADMAALDALNAHYSALGSTLQYL